MEIEVKLQIAHSAEFREPKFRAFKKLSVTFLARLMPAPQLQTWPAGGRAAWLLLLTGLTLLMPLRCRGAS